MILSLLLTISVLAAPLTEKWSVKTEGGSPVAAFFDVSSASLFVSVEESSQTARLDRYDLGGKLVKKGVFRASGKAGNLRAHFGKIYWIAGSVVWRFQPDTGKGERVGEAPSPHGELRDLAVTRSGEVLVGGADGSLYSLAGKGSVRARGAPISGLFLLDNTLYLLRETKLETLDLSGKKEGFLRSICRKKCSGLEKSSSGAWITVEDFRVLEFSGSFSKKNRVLYEAEEGSGRFAYVYDRDTTNDLLIIPFPSSKLIRAFRFQTPP